VIHDVHAEGVLGREGSVRKVKVVDVVAAVGVGPDLDEAMFQGVAPMRRELTLLCRGIS